QHVHVHITTVETGSPKAKRMKKVKEKMPRTQPRMKWYTDDKISNYKVTMNDEGFIQYQRNGEIVAEQERTKYGNLFMSISEY
ncbi:hypothetical protein, partial [Staphylococcus pasteuri]